jgi:c-di-GMP-binding flagellar brake protein YcgR
MLEEASVLPVLQSSSRLSITDVPIGEPLAWPLINADGAPLFDAGATIASLAARTFLFAHFEPHKQDGSVDRAAPAAATSEPQAPPANDLLTLETIGLKIGARLGLRGSAGTAMYSSRVIGFSAAGPQRTGAVFITQPLMSGHPPLALTQGERVELVALTTRDVLQFACTVDAVCREPFHYLVLSEPGPIRRLRARKFVRMPTRLPARLYDAGSDETSPQLGLIRDISPFGMLLAVAEPHAKSGDRLRVSFRFHTDETDVDIDCHAIVRHVHDVDAHGVNGAYGLEFETLEPSQRIALKSFMAEQA